MHGEKLESITKERIFVGYYYRSKSYRICRDWENVIICGTVKFLEGEYRKIIKGNAINNDAKISVDNNLQSIDTKMNNTRNDQLNQQRGIA